MQRYGLQQCQICVVPVVLVHQVYTVLSDRTAADRELCEARESHRLRMMRSGTGARDVVVTTEEAYKYAIHALADAQTSPALQRVFLAFADTVIREVSDLFITRRDLVALLAEGIASGARSGAGSGSGRHSQPARTGASSRARAAVVDMDEAVSQLSACGLLMRKLDAPGSAEAFWFNLPKMGALVSQVKLAREALVKTLKRARYKQILRKKLEAKTRLSKDCNLPIGFILADALGTGVVSAIDSHLGPGTLIGLGPLSK
jgi:hypothetical protein